MRGDNCSVCGGEGRIPGAWGRTTVCPACNGSGRKDVGEPLIRNVTKTKPSHHGEPEPGAKPEKQTWPSTLEGSALANEVKNCPTCPDETKERLIREIIEYEGSHGKCTKTFTRKVRKQLRTTETS